MRIPRFYHQAEEGTIRRKDDLDFWLDMNRDFNVPWGPWGYASGMGVEDVDREEAVAAGVIREDEVARPIEKTFNNGLSAGIRDLDGGLAAALARITGGTVAGGRLVAAKTKFKEMVLPDPEGKGTLHLPDDIYESLRDLTAGKSWGAADVFLGLPVAKIEKYRITEAKELRGAALEEGLLLDRYGEVHRETGGEKRIKWPNELLPGALMSHTHPAGSSFSLEDVEGLLMLGMKGVRAITEKRIFSIRPGNIALPLAKAGDLVRSREFKQAHREAIAIMRTAISSKSTTAEREELITRLVWARLHQTKIVEYQEELWEK